MRPRKLSELRTQNMFVKSLVLLLLVLAQNPASCLLQGEHTLFHRGAGTSFSLANAGKSGNNQVHMQVCITIGCCHHVCRQFVDDSGSEPQPQELSQAPFASVESSSGSGSGSASHHEAPGEELQPEVEPVNENVALLPSILEWNPRELFSPSIKSLRVLNTGNSSWIGVSKPVCTNEQFSVQEIESTAIAPGESLRIPVVFIPQKAGAVSGKIILQTSAGTVVSQLRGEGNISPYQASIEAGLESEQGLQSSKIITFQNPHEEALEIQELQVWPENSYNKALCLSEESDGRITSCSTDGFPKAHLSDLRYEKYSHHEESISLKPLHSWRINPGQKIRVAELEMKVNRDWSGLLYMKFQRNRQDQVLIFPVEVKMVRNSEEVAPRSPETKVDGSPPASSPGKWMPTSDLVAIKVAEALLKDLSHTLLRQPQIKRGSLTPNGREQALVLEDQVSFQMVQTGFREKLWINLVNPTSSPLLVNLILPSEVKSSNCRYRANWFWQGQNPQVLRESNVFSFEAGAQTEAMIPALGKVSLGPLTFHPRYKCNWLSLLFIKNNSTGLDWVPVFGLSGSAKLQFLENESATRNLELFIGDDRSQGEDEELLQKVCHQEVVKTVQVRNAGDMPLQVYSMDLSEAPQITLQEGSSSFSLDVGETSELRISYQPDFQVKATKQVLKMATSVGVVKLPVIPRLSRGVVSRCKNSLLHEKLVLPVSLCALVLVMGVFFWLLLQELSAKGAINKEKLKASIWKEVWSVLPSVSVSRRTRTGALKKPKQKLEESGVVTLKTFHQELPEKCKLRKKKKMKSTSSPCCQSASSSTPGSPHSGSETEMQLPAFERILSSTRFSKKNKMRISVVSEEVVMDREVEAAWRAKLGAADIRTSQPGADIPPSTNMVNHNPNSVNNVNQKTKKSKSTSSCAATQVGENGLCTPAVASAPQPVPNLAKDEPQRSSMVFTSNRFASSSTFGENTGYEEVKQPSEPLYDIWGDHLTEIFTAFSSPNSPNHFSGNNQSFFSQNLHSCGSTCFREDVTHHSGYVAEQQQQQLLDDVLLPSSEEDLFTSTPEDTNSNDLHSPNWVLNNFNLSFLQQAESYAELLEPRLVDWNANSIYRHAVSEIA